MCGITGFVDFKKEGSVELLSSMVKCLRHRGPDDLGVELIRGPSALAGLAQSRLSIIDLSSAGHQPMTYNDLTIVFNGEIYNYLEVKSDLVKRGHVFMSSSDTEVILHAVDEWGEAAVEKFVGMFVYVIYDKSNQSITITRDRAGVKPLFYYYRQNLFLFGSELKSLMEHPNFKKEIDLEALPNYFQYGYIPAPYSIFKGCFKLMPGHHLVLNLQDQRIEIKEYWNILTFYKKPKLNISYDDAKQHVHNLLKSSCNYRMISDVPVGVFLSGGYDSTAVTAILQKDQTRKIKTFTIGFEGKKNEAPFAKETSLLLGTDHTEYICSTDEAQKIIPSLPYFYDEPFADSSAIPSILVSSLAKKQVSVVLSADGGDELFCGYNRYFLLERKLKMIKSFPSLLHGPLKALGSFLKLFTSIIPVNYFQKIDAFGQAIDNNPSDQSASLFRTMHEMPKNYLQDFFKKSINSQPSPFRLNNENFKSSIEVAMAIDYGSYLQNDILTKVDRATMSVSLEGREPFLDHRLIEYVAQLPFEFKYDGTEGKKILKDIVHEYVPKAMMDRPKTGFSLPIYQWLNGDLSYLLNDYLSMESLKWSGIFNEAIVYKQVQDFKEGKLHYKPLIWKFLMFQMWYKKWMIV